MMECECVWGMLWFSNWAAFWQRAFSRRRVSLGVYIIKKSHRPSVRADRDLRALLSNTGGWRSANASGHGGNTRCVAVSGECVRRAWVAPRQQQRGAAARSSRQRRARVWVPRLPAPEEHRLHIAAKSLVARRACETVPPTICAHLDAVIVIARGCSPPWDYDLCDR